MFICENATLNEMRYMFSTFFCPAVCMKLLQPSVGSVFEEFWW